jgi:hypothetical protein
MHFTLAYKRILCHIFHQVAPFDQANPLKKGRIQHITELIAANHWMEYAEIDCTK